MKIAVVILNWNGKKLLEQFLPSIVEHSKEATIYVADNASTDESIFFVENNFPSVKIIRNAGNFGYAKGYNEALKFVEEEIYALVNSDIEVTQNWLNPVLAEFLQNPETGIVQPKILDFKQRDYFEYAGAAGGFIDKYGYPFCRGRIFTTIEKDENQYHNDTIFWASGACFFIRKSLFKKLEGFDSDFFAHQEEIDLCWRAFHEGAKVKYIAGSTVYHVGGATLNHTNPQKTFLNFRNSLLMLVKNLPKSQFYSVLIMRMILDGIAGLRFLSRGEWNHFIAVLKAHGSFYRLFSANYSKRRVVSSLPYFKVKSIVVLYYVRGQKTFGRLF